MAGKSTINSEVKSKPPSPDSTGVLRHHDLAIGGSLAHFQHAVEVHFVV
jgi:hypothetical protein